MKKCTKTKNKVARALGSVRDKMMQDGAFDGRFRSKTFTDRKKEASRCGCRYDDNNY
jgi:hypothetical protein